MKRVLIFGGTTEGRELAQFCEQNQIPATVSVATEYGKSLLSQEAYQEQINVICGYRNQQELEVLMKGYEWRGIIDATHPYALNVSEQVRAAAEILEIPCMRLLRAQELADESQAVWVNSVAEAAKFLKDRTGNILITTGSKDLEGFLSVGDVSRLYPRVLPSAVSLQICEKTGILQKNVLALQGPFSKELNAAILRQYQCSWLVTKESGKAGGYREKLLACQETGARPVIVRRPGEQTGWSMDQIRAWLLQSNPVESREESVGGAETQITIAGIGMGALAGMTQEVLTAIQRADACIGSGRMLEAVGMDKPVLDSYKPEEIRAWIEAHPKYRRVVILTSGDTGFYSVAKALLPALQGYAVSILPGISSVSYLSARLGISWDDMFLCSIHGRRVNLIQKIQTHQKVFALLGSQRELHELCKKMLEFDMDLITIHVGEALSYPEESIWSGSPKEALNHSFGKLCSVIFVNNGGLNRFWYTGIEESYFLRDRVPMTKEEIRCVSIAKLRIRPDSVVFDVGAGTGSVAIEASLAAPEGMVYAIEKKPLAADLIRRNAIKFQVSNLEVLEGEAPEILKKEPQASLLPTHAFIGGSSGKLSEIVEVLMGKNPDIRIVVNAIAIETLAELASLGGSYSIEYIQVQVSKGKSIEAYHLMMAQNPVMIAVITKR